MAIRKRPGPRQSIKSLTVNIQRCFDRLDEFTQTTSNAMMDFDHRLSSCMKATQEAANIGAQVHAENVLRNAPMPTGGGMLNSVQAKPRIGLSSFIGGDELKSPFTYSPSTKKTFLIRYRSSSGEKKRTVESVGFRNISGFTSFQDEKGVPVFSVQQVKIESIEVID